MFDIPGLKGLDLDLEYLETRLVEAGVKVTHYEAPRKVEDYEQRKLTPVQVQRNEFIKKPFVDIEDPYFQKSAREMGVDFPSVTREELYKNPKVDVEIFGDGGSSIGKYTLSLEFYKSIIGDTLRFVNNHYNSLSRLNSTLYNRAIDTVYEKLKNEIIIEMRIWKKGFRGIVEPKLTDCLSMSKTHLKTFDIRKIIRSWKEAEDYILLYNSPWKSVGFLKKEKQQLWISPNEAQKVVDAHRKELRKLKARKDAKTARKLFKNYMRERIILLLKERLESRSFMIKEHTGL